MIPVPRHSVTGDTIFTVMSALAAQHGAINLSQGFPDYPVDPRMEQWLSEAVRNGFNQYAPMSGLPVLRQAIAAYWQRAGISLDPELEITVTPGASYAIYTAFAAALRPGDEAIVLEPAYDCYIPAIEMNGGIPVPVPLRFPDFGIDWDRLAAAITDKTRAIIVNTPHNPCGTVMDASEWDRLAGLVRGKDILIVSDEVYEQLVFDGAKHISVMSHPELRERSFAVFSFGKTFHATGWKMGYCIASPLWTKAFRSVHQYIAFSVNSPAQYALAQALDQTDFSEISRMLQQKRDLFLDLLKDTGFRILQPARGSYFQLAEYSARSSEADLAFSRRLTEQCGVAPVPVSAFYSSKKDDHLVRFCFAKKDETLIAAAERLQNHQIVAAG